MASAPAAVTGIMTLYLNGNWVVELCTVWMPLRYGSTNGSNRTTLSVTASGPLGLKPLDGVVAKRVAPVLILVLTLLMALKRWRFGSEMTDVPQFIRTVGAIAGLTLRPSLAWIVNDGAALLPSCTKRTCPAAICAVVKPPVGADTQFVPLMTSNT